MRSYRLTLPLLAAVLMAAAPVQASPVETSAPTGDRPSLVVAIAVDQLSANLFNQYRPWFTGGLRTLSDQGMVHVNGYQTHAITVTCAGHATILTGLHPARNGIPANDWIDPVTGEMVYCLAAPDNTLAHGRNTDNGPVGPGQMTATTLGDWLKAESPQSRVFAVSGKDRGAIAMAGRDDDGAFWFTEGFGLTTYVEPGQTAEDRLAPVAAFNAGLIARFTAEAPGWDYRFERCRALAGEWTVADAPFPARLPPANFVVDTSPILDELTVEAALMLMETQQLGRRGVTDVLSVSLSATDRIGHVYGTQGPEMCEQMLRLDAALGQLMDAVARTPGAAVVVLTADHGGSDMPERMAAYGNQDARRADPTLIRRVNDALKAEFALDANPLRSSARGFIMVGADGKELAEPLRSRVAAAAADLLNAEPTVAMAVTRDALLAEAAPTEPNPELLSVRERLRLSAVAGRSPDVMLAYTPFHNGAVRVGGTVANHGSPWDYDRRVPIIFWRTDGQGQERFWPIRTVDIGPSLAHAVGVAAPDDLDGRCLDLGVPGAGPCPVEP